MAARGSDWPLHAAKKLPVGCSLSVDGEWVGRVLIGERRPLHVAGQGRRFAGQCVQLQFAACEAVSLLFPVLPRVLLRRKANQPEHSCRLSHKYNPHKIRIYNTTTRSSRQSDTTLQPDHFRHQNLFKVNNTPIAGILPRTTPTNIEPSRPTRKSTTHSAPANLTSERTPATLSTIRRHVRDNSRPTNHDIWLQGAQCCDLFCSRTTTRKKGGNVRNQTIEHYQIHYTSLQILDLLQEDPKPARLVVLSASSCEDPLDSGRVKNQSRDHGDGVPLVPQEQDGREKPSSPPYILLRLASSPSSAGRVGAGSSWPPEPQLAFDHGPVVHGDGVPLVPQEQDGREKPSSPPYILLRLASSPSSAGRVFSKQRGWLVVAARAPASTASTITHKGCSRPATMASRDEHEDNRCGGVCISSHCSTERLTCSPLIKAIRVQSPAVSPPDFRMADVAAGRQVFLRDLPFPPALAFRHFSVFARNQSPCANTTSKTEWIAFEVRILFIRLCIVRCTYATVARMTEVSARRRIWRRGCGELTCVSGIEQRPAKQTTAVCSWLQAAPVITNSLLWRVFPLITSVRRESPRNPGALGEGVEIMGGALHLLPRSAPLRNISGRDTHRAPKGGCRFTGTQGAQCPGCSSTCRTVKEVRDHSGQCNPTCWHLISVHDERLDCPPPPQPRRTRVQSPAGSLPDFRMWGSCRTMPLVGGIFSGISRYPCPLHSGATPFSPHFTSIDSQDLVLCRNSAVDCLHWEVEPRDQVRTWAITFPTMLDRTLVFCTERGLTTALSAVRLLIKEKETVLGRTIAEFASSDFGKPGKTEISMSGQGIKPECSRTRVQCVETAPPRSRDRTHGKFSGVDQSACEPITTVEHSGIPQTNTGSCANTQGTTWSEKSELSSQMKDVPRTESATYREEHARRAIDTPWGRRSLQLYPAARQRASRARYMRGSDKADTATRIKCTIATIALNSPHLKCVETHTGRMLNSFVRKRVSAPQFEHHQAGWSLPWPTLVVIGKKKKEKNFLRFGSARNCRAHAMLARASAIASSLEGSRSGMKTVLVEEATFHFSRWPAYRVRSDLTAFDRTSSPLKHNGPTLAVTPQSDVLLHSDGAARPRSRRRGSDTGDTNTHASRLIAPTRMACSVSFRDRHWNKMAGEREIPDKTRRPAALSGTITTCEIPGATPPGIETGSPWWEAISLTTTPPPSPMPIKKNQRNSFTTKMRYDVNTARLARRSDETVEVRVSVARIAPSELSCVVLTNQTSAAYPSILQSDVAALNSFRLDFCKEYCGGWKLGERHTLRMPHDHRPPVRPPRHTIVTPYGSGRLFPTGCSSPRDVTAILPVAVVVDSG
ncbi:hypothetical protein PR048_018980 [Dryococelus australis]|uniref:Uncharacterized protein n=1 Tax=Dryococelus australis TaxID=614101 RepID=A0ABQ9H269_9NEOP|nr:hypothetical protein PR048_018980 [Dryococelus australis]